MEKFVNLLEKNRLPDMGKPWSPLIPYKFYEYLTPETLKIAVLQSSEIDRICKFYSGDDTKKEHELRRVVQAILEEIGFKRNMTVIRFLGIVLNKVLIQMTTGVFVNQESIITVKRELAKSRSPVLYLPSHRSYADFVLMSYMCFAHDLEIPAIAAGMGKPLILNNTKNDSTKIWISTNFFILFADFHGMVGMGSMLRNTGAFFMRRSFSTDKMYWEVFREYVRTLITKYHSGVEFFIEGTRSRSSKALTPKIGLFTMLLEPFLKRHVFDLTIIPVGVSYDRPVEEQLFAYEMLGVPKPKESTKGLFKVFEIMDSCHGGMFVNFGQPMSLFDYFERDRSIYFPANDKTTQTLSKDRLQLIGTLSREIVDKQQQLIVLTTFNLIAIYFNYRTMCNETCNRDQLKYGIGLLTNFLKKFEALLACEIPSQNVSNIDDSLDIHSNVLSFNSRNVNGSLRLVFGPRIASTSSVDPKKLKGHALVASTMQRCLPSILLQIYANPCLYWLHRPAFYVLVKRMNIQKEDEAGEIQRLKQIFVHEFVTRKDDDIQDLDKSIIFWESLDITGNVELSNVLLASIVPFIFCYFNVVNVINTQVI